MGLTSRQESFCQAILNPENSQADAYILAYETPKDTPIDFIYQRASRLMASAKIKARIEELRTAEYLSQPWSVDQMRARLEDKSNEAAEAGQYGPSIRALEMIGKLDGLIVDRKKITGSLALVNIELSTEELRQLVADGQNIRERYKLPSPGIADQNADIFHGKGRDKTGE